MLTFGMNEFIPSDESASDISHVEYGQTISISCDGTLERSVDVIA